MLKIILTAIILLMNLAWANHEPQEIIVVADGKIHLIQLSKLKKTDLLTVNHHPNFKDLGKQKYSGYLIRDILKGFSPSLSRQITIIGKTGQFSVGLLASELLTGNNLIATELNGVPFQTEGNGLQIIYDEETLARYPALSQRQFWCWWVRTLILDEKFKPTIKVSYSKATTLKSAFPWPTPYGISSKGPAPTVNQRTGSILKNFKTLQVELLNGSNLEVVSDEKSTYFMADPVNNKAGGYTLHKIIENNDQVKTIVSNLYYIKSLEVLK